MLFIRRSKKLRKRQSAWLYSVVFHGAFSTCLIFLLFASFLIQPIHKAVAAEPTETSEEPAPVADEVKEQIEEPEEAPPPEAEIIEEAQPEESVDVVSEEIVDDSVVTEEETESDDVVEDGSVSEEEIITEEIEEVDSPEDVVIDEDGQDEVDQTETNSDDPEEDSAGEVTEKPKEDTVVQVESLITEDNFYQFSKQSCVLVGNDTYHCSAATESDVDASSVVYAELDAEGDMEIYLRTSKNKIKQITDNQYDDTAPSYDPESMRIVWQRLIDGREQIVVFDIMEDEETQLTFSKTNNMEPKVSESGIVWQAWDNHDWEIMLFDGSYTEQLTENDAQDVAPVIQDEYVLWNVLGGEEQQARVYSLDTKETVSIEGYEGGSISNPRFVLVYDTKYENGDVVTQSFDPTTGLSEPIAAKPASEPVNIPESDPIGEIRALISNKSKDEKLVPEVSGDGDAGPTPPPDDGTLVLSAPEATSSQAVFIPATTTEDDFELTEYDLVIPEGAFENAMQGNSSSAQ